MITLSLKDLFPFISSYIPQNPVILEAGAFNGRDTLRLRNFWPQAKIHAFEPVPEIFKELSHNTSCYTQITCYPFALSNSDGTQLFYCAQNPKKPSATCQAGTLNKPKDRLLHSPIIYPKTIKVPTYTINSWAMHYTISQIDFMWLDLQGHELSVLETSENILNTVSVIFLEVNFIEAYENQPTLSMLTDWLKVRNFIPVARDFHDNHHSFFGNIIYLKISK